MPEGATNKQGFYVVAKLLEVGEPADLLPLAAKMFPGGPQLTADLHSSESWRGIKVMVSLVEAMVCCSSEAPASGLGPVGIDMSGIMRCAYLLLSQLSTWVCTTYSQLIAAAERPCPAERPHVTGSNGVAGEPLWSVPQG